jgi:hypothetical protein
MVTTNANGTFGRTAIPTGTVSNITLTANGGSSSSITTTGTVDISGSGGTSVSKSGNSYTISSTAPSTWGDFGTNIQSWGSTGGFGSGKDVGIGIQPSKDFDVNGTTRLRGAIYDSGNSPGTSGQVLTSNGSGAWTWTTPTASFAAGYHTNGEYTTSFTANTYKKVDFNAVDFIGSYQISGSQPHNYIGVPSSGSYEINYNVCLNAPTANYATVMIQVNGTNIGRSKKYVNLFNGTAEQQCISGTIIMSLNANDQISLNVMHDFNQSGAYVGGPQLNIKKLN